MSTNKNQTLNSTINNEITQSGNRTKSTRRSFKVLFLPFFLMLFIVSCKENDNSVVYTPELGILNTEIIIHDYSNAWNANNPYDSIGFIHNQALDYYALNSNPDTTFLNLNSALDYIDDIISPYFILNNINVGTKIDRLNTFNSIFIQPASIYNSPLEYIASKYSAPLTNKFTELFLILSTHVNDYNIISICNQIKAKENEVVISNVLTNSEKEIFLKTSSVLKFSSIYWIEVKNGIGASNYYENFDTNPEIPGDSTVCGPITTNLVDGIAESLGMDTEVASMTSIAFKIVYEYFQTTTYGWFLPDLP